MDDKDYKKIEEVIEGIDTFMLVTHQNNNGLMARPMGLVRRENSLRMYFFTARQSEKTHEILSNSYVLLTYQNEDKYVSIKGRASILRDKQIIEDLWKEQYRVWFPKGLEDPSLALICFAAEELEYWDSQGINKVRYIYNAVKGYVSGKQPEIPESVHDKFSIK